MWSAHRAASRRPRHLALEVGTCEDGTLASGRQTDLAACGGNRMYMLPSSLTEITVRTYLVPLHMHTLVRHWADGTDCISGLSHSALPRVDLVFSRICSRSCCLSCTRVKSTEPPPALAIEARCVADGR
jgi:hypothetical protein